MLGLGSDAWRGASDAQDELAESCAMSLARRHNMITSLSIVRAVNRGELLAEEALEHCIARIEVTDPRVNAFTDGTFERAVNEARAIDAQRARGEVLPPLAGVPYAVKNLFDIESRSTRAGGLLHADQAVAAADAVLVQRMKAAGAVLVGALNMDELADGFSPDNAHYGPCRNPRQLERTAGGSSGGCAAAVAAGQVPITLARTRKARSAFLRPCAASGG